MIIRILWNLFFFFFILFIASPVVKNFFFYHGFRWLYILVFSILFANFITPFCALAGLKLNILDRPDWRKIHENPTPLFGGIAIYIAFALSLFLNKIFPAGTIILLYGATAIFLMGLLDDIRPLPPLFKLFVQIIVSLAVILLGDINLTFFYGTSLAPFVNIPLTIIWIVGLTNAMNFFDGIDGLAVSMSIVISFFLGILAFNTDQPGLGWFAVALGGACLGFLPHNFRFGKSALLFLGDAGSTFLGFTLAGLAILGRWSDSSNFVSLTSPMLIFGVLIFDMIYVTLSRIKNRKNNGILSILTKPNKDHLHHRLLFIGFARKETVFVISILSTCLGVSALIIMNKRFVEALLGLLQSVLILGLIVALMIKGRERISKEEDKM